MIRDEKILKNAAEEWPNDGTADEKAMTWIWNQLMGETAKGDTLEFLTLTRGTDEDYEKLYAGILRDHTGSFKFAIPAMYEKFSAGVIDVIEVDGRTKHDDMDSLNPHLEIGKTDVDWDEIGRKFC